MKIIQLVAENFKRLKAVSIKPDGSLIQITGRNEQGKSTVLDAIAAAIGGSAFSSDVPIRTGEKKAHITLDLGEYVVTRKFTPSGGSLTVEAANGAQFKSPQKMLDDLIGSLSFDPLAFIRMKPDKQLETLRGMVHLTVDLDALDAANCKDYVERANLTRDLKALEARRAAVPYFPSNLPEVMVDIGVLAAELQKAGEHNMRVAQEKRSRENREGLIVQWNEEIDELRLRISELQARITKEVTVLHTMPPIDSPINTEDIALQIKQAKEINNHIQNKNNVETLDAQLSSTEAKRDGLTGAMEHRTAEKQAAISAAEMPVAGLSFGDGMVLYNGLPFAQASQAQQIRVSVAIAMAGNPRLRIISIRDGSLLDEQAMHALEEMADLNDFQIWIERVDSSGKVGIVIEDGAVVPHE